LFNGTPRAASRDQWYNAVMESTIWYDVLGFLAIVALFAIAVVGSMGCDNPFRRS
jgi:hypothetical protein